MIARASLQNGERRVTVNGVSHWCKVAGAEHGTIPLVAIHGGPGSTTYYLERTVGPHLEAFATVIYYDQRGSGRSDRPDDEAYSMALLVDDLEQLRQALGLGPIIPLGTSFGGELALEYALAHPQHVTQLILQAPPVDWERTALVQYYGLVASATGEFRHRCAEIQQACGSLDECRRQVREAADLDAFMRMSFHDHGLIPRAVQLIQESGEQENPALKKAIHAERRQPLLGRVAAIRVPTLVLVGLYDRHTGVDMVRDLAEQLPNAQLQIFAHSAHYPDAEEPETFAAWVQQFLGGHGD